MFDRVEHNSGRPSVTYIQTDATERITLLRIRAQGNNYTKVSPCLGVNGYLGRSLLFGLSQYNFHPDSVGPPNYSRHIIVVSVIDHTCMLEALIMC